MSGLREWEVVDAISNILEDYELGKIHTKAFLENLKEELLSKSGEALDTRLIEYALTLGSKPLGKAVEELKHIKNEIRVEITIAGQLPLLVWEKGKKELEGVYDFSLLSFNLGVGKKDREFYTSILAHGSSQGYVRFFYVDKNPLYVELAKKEGIPSVRMDVLTSRKIRQLF